MGTFVHRLSRTEGGWRVDTYSERQFLLTSQEIIKGLTTNLGQLDYYVVTTRSHGRIRFLLSDGRQERDLVQSLGLAPEALG